MNFEIHLTLGELVPKPGHGGVSGDDRVDADESVPASTGQRGDKWGR